MLLGEFLEWLETHHMTVAVYFPGDAGLGSLGESPTKLIHRFLEINERELEAERRALLDYQRALNEEPL